MTEISHAPSQRSRTATRDRALAVLGAVVATGLLWAIAKAVDVDLVVDPKNGNEAGAVPLPIALGFALVSALLGWAALEVLERLIPRRAALIWTILAVAVLLVSMVPLFGVGATAGTKTILALMHVAVAAVLIPGMLRTTRR
ncbi:MAG TPA: DUF6069 family protein [Pilimelia sp.]|nr:DUF6069 family protein [Pilimelia sp.]